MIKYRIYKNNNPESAAYGKWYARAVHEMMEFDEFIRHMASHHCVFSEGVIRGVLIETENCLRELLLEGKAVRLDGLGIFTLSIANRKGGAEKPEDFKAGMIEGMRMNLFLGSRFRARDLRKEARFREADRYDGGIPFEPDQGAETAGSGDGD